MGKVLKQTARKSTRNKPATKKVEKNESTSPQAAKKTKRRGVQVEALCRYQKSTELLIRRLPFQRIVRDITMKIQTDIKWQTLALAILQEATESYIIGLFEDTNVFDEQHVITPRDILMARRLSQIEHM